MLAGLNLRMLAGGTLLRGRTLVFSAGELTE
jgi:hypothetical protein